MAGGSGASADRDVGARSGADSDIPAHGSVRREASGSHPRDEKTRGNGQVQRRILNLNGFWSRALSPTPVYSSTALAWTECSFRTVENDVQVLAGGRKQFVE